MSEIQKTPRLWYQKKRYIIPLVLVVLFIVGLIASPSKPKTADSNSATPTVVAENKNAEPAKPAGPKEGDVISGIGRKDLEDKYDTQQKLSKFKADEYAKTLSGQNIVWVGKVDNVDTSIDGTPYISIKMGIYSVNVNDPSKKWVSNFVKGDLVKITGKIDKLVETFGVDIYVNATDITKV